MHRKSAYSYPGDEDQSDDEMDMPSIKNQQQGRRKAIDALEAVFDTTFEDMVSGGNELPGASATPFMQPNLGKYQWIADPYSQGKYEGPIPSKRAARDGTFAASAQGELAKKQRDTLVASQGRLLRTSESAGQQGGLEPKASPAAIAMAINDKRAPKPSDTERVDAHCLTSHPPPQMVSSYTSFPNASVNPYTGTSYTYNPCGAMVAPRPPINLGYEFSIANGEMAAAPPMQQYGQVHHSQQQQQHYPLGQMPAVGGGQQQQNSGMMMGGGGAPFALPQPTSYTASNYPLAPPYSTEGAYRVGNMMPHQQQLFQQQQSGSMGASESVRYVPVQVLSQPVPYSIGPQVIRPANPYYVNYTPPEAASDVGLGYPLNQHGAQHAFRASSVKYEDKEDESFHSSDNSQLSRVRQEHSEAVLIAKKWKQVASLFAVGACALVGLHLFDWASSSKGTQVRGSSQRGWSNSRHSSAPSTPSSMQSF